MLKAGEKEKGGRGPCPQCKSLGQSVDPLENVPLRFLINVSKYLLLSVGNLVMVAILENAFPVSGNRKWYLTFYKAFPNDRLEAILDIRGLGVVAEQPSINQEQ